MSLENSKGWAMTSYHVFERLMALLPKEDHGVRMRPANFFFDRRLEELPDQYEKMKEIECCGVRTISASMVSIFNLRDICRLRNSSATPNW